MLFKIARRDLWRKPIQHLLTVLMAGTAIGLSIAVMLSSASLKEGMSDAAMPFDMIVGDVESPTQLVLNTIFLQDTAVGNISHDVWDSLAADERVSRVIPFAFGDTYEGYRLVGTATDVFDLRPSREEPSIFQLEKGEFWDGSRPSAAVIGATAAKELGLSVGDTFTTTHGLTHDGNEEAHGSAFTVVGILKTMNMPYDTGIFVPIEAMWEMHGNEAGDVTALMVTPYDYSGLYQLYTEINGEKDAQAVFPGVVMGEIFESLGQSEDIMQIITWIAMAVGLIGMAVSLSWSALSRTRENAIMRAVGSGRGAVLGVVLLEGAMLSLASAVTGTVIGHLTGLCIAKYMQNTSAFYSPVMYLPGEGIVLAAAVAVGLALSLIPSLKAYRTDVQKDLLNI